MGRQRANCPPLVHGLAGCCSGMVATACLFPLDLLKTRLQSNEAAGAGRSLVATARAVVRVDGIRGLYAGLSANLVGSGMAWGLYFYGYTTLKDTMRTAGVGDSSWTHFLAANLTGASVAVVTNPIWVVKTRMQLQGRSAGAGPRYASVWDGLRSLARDEGPRGLLRGVAPNLLGVTHGSIYFVFYEDLRRRLQERRRAESCAPSSAGGGARTPRENLAHPSDRDTLVVSGASKVVALLATYPLQVVRTRLQRFEANVRSASSSGGSVAHSSGGGASAAVAVAPPAAASNALSMRHAVSAIWRNEGARGFYKGLFPAAIREVPATCITFVVYEALVRNYLGEV